jgi:long-chain acyl-CoA synthetase
MYLRLLSHPGLAQFDLTSLRLCTVGGQTTPVNKLEEIQQRLGCPLVELWGMTEIGGLGITHLHDAPRKLGSIGVVLPLCEAKVVDPTDAGKTLPRGEAGELMFRGPLVMDGYWGDPDATREALTSDGWLHTGDIVTQDLEGYFHVVDRKKDVIISGGYKVYPAEVERVIAQHPAVAMVAVAAMLDDVKGHVPKAFVVLHRGAQITAAAIIEHCRRELAAYKTPKAVEFMDDLPRTSTGKTLRRALVAKA